MEGPNAPLGVAVAGCLSIRQVVPGTAGEGDGDGGLDEDGSVGVRGFWAVCCVRIFKLYFCLWEFSLFFSSYRVAFVALCHVFSLCSCEGVTLLDWFREGNLNRNSSFRGSQRVAQGIETPAFPAERIRSRASLSNSKGSSGGLKEGGCSMACLELGGYRGKVEEGE